MLWVPAVAACTTPWRLPNLRELHELYKAMGGNGRSTTNFGNLTSPNSNPGGANAMISSYYWSSSDYSNSYAYFFGFGNGYRYGGDKANGSYYVRCVREL
jgi:hypothetical protein